MATVGLGVDLPIEAHLTASFAEVVRYCNDRGAAAVGVDMPIGLAADGARSADAEARAILGPRRSTLFPTPSGAVLDATDYETALELCRAETGKGLSKQAFNLLPKIREVRDCLRPGDQPRFSEVHPETSFTVMAGRPLAPKTTLPGQLERIDLVSAMVGLLPVRLVGLVEGGGGQMLTGAGEAKLDDLLDACAAAWTARRMVTGEARTLGGGYDPDGHALTILV